MYAMLNNAAGIGRNNFSMGRLHFLLNLRPQGLELETNQELVSCKYVVVSLQVTPSWMQI